MILRRAFCGSVTPSSDGTSHHRNSIICFRHCCKGSNSMIQLDGQHKCPPSLQSFKNDWQHDTPYKALASLRSSVVGINCYKPPRHLQLRFCFLCSVFVCSRPLLLLYNHHLHVDPFVAVVISRSHFYIHT
jgi:hypothetical protein